MNGLSILIPYHQEGKSFITDTIRSIKETIDVELFEILVIDDGSKVPLEIDEGVRVIYHSENKGVGQAFRTGIDAAKYEHIFLQGSDIRYIKNQWASKMMAEIDQHPKSLICTTCVGLNGIDKDGMDFEKRRQKSRRNGANILFYHDSRSHPKKSPSFRNILEAQWIRRSAVPGTIEVPCILGAAYGANKEWLKYIDIWWGHRSWGTLEPFCSLASWLMGGSCLCAQDIETGHIFKKSGTHGVPGHHLMYNKMLVATLLLPDHLAQSMIAFLGENNDVSEGKRIFDSMKESIFTKRDEYAEKITMDVRDYCNKFNIDLRE